MTELRLQTADLFGLTPADVTVRDLNLKAHTCVLRLGDAVSVYFDTAAELAAIGHRITELAELAEQASACFCGATHLPVQA